MLQEGSGEQVALVAVHPAAPQHALLPVQEEAGLALLEDQRHVHGQLRPVVELVVVAPGNSFDKKAVWSSGLRHGGPIGQVHLRRCILRA